MDFSDFGSIMEAWAPPENLEKLKKSRKHRFWIAFGAHWLFHGRFGRVWGAFWVGFGGFWDGFGKVWGGFWERLGTAAAQPNCLRTKVSASFEEPSF